MLDRIGQEPTFDHADDGSGRLTNSRSWRGGSYLLMLWSGFHESSAMALVEILKCRSKHPFRILGIYTWHHKGGKAKLEADLERLGYDWPQVYTYESVPIVRQS